MSIYGHLLEQGYFSNADIDRNNEDRELPMSAKEIKKKKDEEAKAREEKRKQEEQDRINKKYDNTKYDDSGNPIYPDTIEESLSNEDIVMKQIALKTLSLLKKEYNKIKCNKYDKERFVIRKNLTQDYAFLVPGRDDEADIFKAKEFKSYLKNGRLIIGFLYHGSSYSNLKEYNKLIDQYYKLYDQFHEIKINGDKDTIDNAANKLNEYKAKVDSFKKEYDEASRKYKDDLDKVLDKIQNDELLKQYKIKISKPYLYLGNQGGEDSVYLIVDKNNISNIISESSIVNEKLSYGDISAISSKVLQSADYKLAESICKKVLNSFPQIKNVLQVSSNRYFDYEYEDDSKINSNIFTISFLKYYKKSELNSNIVKCAMQFISDTKKFIKAINLELKKNKSKFTIKIDRLCDIDDILYEAKKESVKSSPMKNVNEYRLEARYCIECPSEYFESFDDENQKNARIQAIIDKIPSKDIKAIYDLYDKVINWLKNPKEITAKSSFWMADIIDICKYIGISSSDFNKIISSHLSNFNKIDGSNFASDDYNSDEWEKLIGKEIYLLEDLNDGGGTYFIYSKSKNKCIYICLEHNDCEDIFKIPYSSNLFDNYYENPDVIKNILRLYDKKKGYNFAK